MSTALVISGLFAAFLLGGLLVAEYLCRRVQSNHVNRWSEDEPAEPNARQRITDDQF